MVGFLESFFLPGYMDWGKLRSKNKKEWNQWLAILTKKAWSKRICLPFFLLKLTLQGFLSNEHNIYFIFLSREATNSCKNVETLQWKTGLSLLQISASCTSVIYNTDRPSLPFPSLSLKVVPPRQYGLVLLATLIRGGGGNHKHKIMDRSFKQKWGTVSQVFLQLIAALYKKKASIDYSAQQDCITISVYFLFYFIVKELISTHMIKVFRGWY